MRRTYPPWPKRHAPSDKNGERYKALGFESTFDGATGGVQWSDLIEDLKTNVLRQDLRVRKLIMGEYNTKVGNEDLAKVPTPPPASWDGPTKRQVSLALLLSGEPPLTGQHNL